MSNINTIYVDNIDDDRQIDKNNVGREDNNDNVVDIYHYDSKDYDNVDENEYNDCGQDNDNNDDNEDDNISYNDSDMD